MNLKALALGFWLALVSLPAQASPLLQEAFSAFSRVRSYERQLELLSIDQNTEPDALLEKRQQLSASLTEAKIHFQTALRGKLESLPSFEQSLFLSLKSGKKGNLPPEAQEEEVLAQLSQEWKDSRNFSALEWEIVEDWFGKRIQQRLIKHAFSIKEIPEKMAEMENPKIRILWIIDPYLRMRLKSKAAFEAEVTSVVSAFEEKDQTVEILELSPFAKIDQQAAELFHSLSLKEESYILLTKEEASGILLRAMDLYPNLRQATHLKGWINWNGKLYGRKPIPSKARGLASIQKKRSRPTDIEMEANAELGRLWALTSERPLPLSSGFPIWNFLSWKNSAPPKENLREKLVVEGKSWITVGEKQEKSPSELIPLLSEISAISE